MSKRPTLHAGPRTTTHFMDDLACELTVDLMTDSNANQWHGYDMTLPDGRLLRIAQEQDQQTQVEVYLMTPNGVLLSSATFSLPCPEVAIAAFAKALVAR